MTPPVPPYLLALAFSVLGLLVGYLADIYSGRTRRALENVWAHAWHYGYLAGHERGAFSVLEQRANLHELRPRKVGP